jgi:hypothetical protein
MLAKSASSGEGRAPACARAKIAAACSRRSSSSAIRASSRFASREARSSRDERAVLVQRRPAGRAVLLERERQLGAGFELGAEHAEGAEAEGAQRSMKGGSPHAERYSAAGNTPPEPA